MNYYNEHRLFVNVSYNGHMIVYLICNKINGKGYVGVTTKTLSRRIKNHLADAAAGKETALHRAIRKYGISNFTVIQIASGLTVEGLLEAEIKIIEQLKTLSPHGYNMTSGGDGTPGLKHSKSAKEKISKASSGRIVSIETREKLRIAHLGKKLTKEHREKLAIAHTGKKLPKRTPEHCRKIAEGLKRAHGRKKEWYL